jgi:hypothetical protein
MHYILVSEVPENLKSNEMVIHKPTFLEEVVATRQKRGIDKVASIRSIRDMIATLASKYDNTVNPFRVNLTKYDNIPYSSDNEFANIIMRVIVENNLPFVEKSIEQQVQNRRLGIDTIYYVSDDLGGTSTLIRFGFNMKDGKNTKKIASNKDSVV